MATEITHEPQNDISLLRATIAGGLALGVVYVSCWVGIFVNIPVSHMLIQIFSTQPIASTAALLEGTIWAVVFGALISLLAAIIYNVVPLGRR
jgi:amino acid transporter